MGMAASQARLLSITARMHDIEYKAQSIQNAKIELATQSDEAYKEYLQALDATTLTVTDLNKNVLTANFNNLCGKNAVETGNKYALISQKYGLIVPDDVADAYYEFTQDGGYDPYEFAMMMMDENAFDYEKFETAQDEIYEKHSDNSSLKGMKDKMDNLLTKAGVEDVNELSPEDQDKYYDLEAAFRHKLFKTYGSEIFEEAYKDEGVDKEDFKVDDFNYYVSIFKQIQAAGGAYIDISAFNGQFGGDAANDSDWLQNMIKSGQIVVSVVNEDSKTGKVSLNDTSPNSDTYLNYTTTSTIDKTALVKAEAEYEHKTKEINQKDKKFDMDLSKLDTERSALSKEYDSVKKVINDNIQRTFGIFS